MKKYLLLGLLAFCANKMYAQQLSFSYDAAGNQIERKWVCINCVPAQASVGGKNTELNRGLLKKQEVELSGQAGRSVKAYPNPVREILHVNWQITEKDIAVKRLQVFNITGVKLYDQNVIGTDQFEIAFNQYPAGTYLFMVTYSDNKKETLKIIKN
jgi:hypothetical protein